MISGQRVQSVLPEVVVEGECGLDGVALHEGEAGAICEAVLLVTEGLEEPPGLRLNLRVYPENMDQRRLFQIVPEGDGHVCAASLFQQG